MTDRAIQTEGLTRTFGDVRAVDDLSLTVEEGEVFGFLGHNGAGKTTTIRLLNGVLQPDAGSVSVLGYDPRTEGTALRRKTGILTETPSLDERLTATENLAFYADFYDIPQAQVQQRIRSILQQFGLFERAGDLVGEYSKGMKQRLALARAFLHEPELLFLDEPTSGLDPVAIQEVHQLIRHVSRDEGRTVFLCTHNLVEAQRLCDRVAVMEQGKMVAVGTPSDLAQRIGAPLRYTLTLAAEHIEAANTVLQQFSAVISTDSTEADDSLKFTIREREAVPDLLANLITANVRVYAVAPEQTSLEDIYMALHNHAEGAVL